MSKVWGQTNTAVITFATIVVVLPFTLLAQSSQTKIPAGLTTPDRVQTQLGTLEFKDGAPSAATAKKVYDNLDYIRAVDAFMNSFSGASAYSIRKGFHCHPATAEPALPGPTGAQRFVFVHSRSSRFLSPSHPSRSHAQQSTG
jgi:hypothetical protein